jgi:hypothetical protein
MLAWENSLQDKKMGQWTASTALGGQRLPFPAPWSSGVGASLRREANFFARLATQGAGDYFMRCANREMLFA